MCKMPTSPEQMQKYLGQAPSNMGWGKLWQRATKEENDKAREILDDSTLSLEDKYRAFINHRDAISARQKGGRKHKKSTRRKTRNGRKTRSSRK